MILPSPELAALLGRAEMLVWEGDPECVFQASACYAATLRALGQIGRGACHLTGVAERWHGTTSELTAVCNGQARRCFIARRGDYLDFRFLWAVNRWLAPSPYRFLLRDLSDTAQIVCLSAEERARAEHHLAWRFVAFDARQLSDFALATIDTRLQLGDFGGIARDLAELAADPLSDPTLLYFCGVARYELGDTTGAQEAWATASGRGCADVYERVYRRYGAGAFGTTTG